MYCLNFNFLIKTNFLAFRNVNLKKQKKIFITNFSYKNVFEFKSVKKNVLFDFLFKNNNIYFFGDNKINIILLNNFFKNLNYIFFNNKKVLFIDSNTEYTLPYYNFVYGFHEINNSKQFFFIDKNSLTINNWIYFYKNFLIKKNISSLIILDYFYFHKFIYSFSKLRTHIFSFFSFRFSNINIDFFFYISSKNYNFIKLIVFNNIINLFFNNYNLNQYFLKRKFFKKLINLKQGTL